MMRERIDFTADIEPIGKGRGRAVAIGGKARVVTPKKTRDWERAFSLIARCHAPREPFAGPVEVEIVATFPRPGYASRRSKRDGALLGGHSPGRYPHTSTPDADNVAKAVLDAMSAWWGDDSQVSALTVRKWVAALGEEPSVRVVVTGASPE